MVKTKTLGMAKDVLFRFSDITAILEITPLILLKLDTPANYVLLERPTRIIPFPL